MYRLLLAQVNTRNKFLCFKKFMHHYFRGMWVVACVMREEVGIAVPNADIFYGIPFCIYNRISQHVTVVQKKVKLCE